MAAVMANTKYFYYYTVPCLVVAIFVLAELYYWLYQCYEDRLEKRKSERSRMIANAQKERVSYFFFLFFYFCTACFVCCWTDDSLSLFFFVSFAAACFSSVFFFLTTDLLRLLFFIPAGISALRSGRSPRKKKTTKSCKATSNGTTKKIGRTVSRGKGGWSTLSRTHEVYTCISN